MFKRTQSKEVDDFAINLAREFSKRCPPDRLQGGHGAISFARAIDEICNSAAEFQRAKQLGVYGKAKLGTEFKLQMKEFGYPVEFIDELTQKLLINMSGK
jgi:hypothetical protein